MCCWNVLFMQVTGIPVVFVSALEGKGRVAIMRQVMETYEKWCLRLSTARLNRWLRKVASHANLEIFLLYNSSYVFYLNLHKQRSLTGSSPLGYESAFLERSSVTTKDQVLHTSQGSSSNFCGIFEWENTTF